MNVLLALAVVWAAVSSLYAWLFYRGWGEALDLAGEALSEWGKTIDALVRVVKSRERA